MNENTNQSQAFQSIAAIDPKSVELLKVHLDEYHRYLERALSAIKILETADPESDEFSDTLAELHVSATVLEPYSEGMVAIDHYTENLPDDAIAIPDP
jgi:hypothetical protein